MKETLVEVGKTEDDKEEAMEEAAAEAAVQVAKDLVLLLLVAGQFGNSRSHIGSNSC